MHHDGALGDVLLSLPALSLLRNRHETLHLAARPDVARLLVEVGLVRETCDPGSTLFSPFYGDQSDTTATAFLKGFDRVFLFTARPEGILAVSMRHARPDTGIVVTVPPGVEMCISDFRLRQVAECLGADQALPEASRAVSPPLPLLEIPGHDRTRARRSLSEAGWDGERPVVIVHPGSGGRRKCWPLVKYLECAQRLVRRQGAFLCFVTGPAEGDYVSVIDSFVRSLPGSAAHVRNEDLPFVAALLSRGSLYIGNDSGVTHLAGLVGCPTVAIFGPTDPRLWKPSGKTVRVITAVWECAPCGDGRLRECSDRRCLSLVSVEDVIREIEGLLRPMKQSAVMSRA